MTQFEQEHDFGEGGGEVDDDTMQQAEQDAAERRSTANEDEDDGPQPWAKASSGETDDV